MKELSLNEMKQLELSLLKDFDRICKKHNLRYSLIYGTLLGAVRHKGFIPWDDDIDVVMPRLDYDRLLAYADEFESDHKLCDHRITADYIHPIAKVIHTKTVLKEKVNLDEIEPLGVYIDIFPADKIPEDPAAFEAFHKRCFHNAQHLAFSVLRYTPTSNPIKNVIKKLVLRYYHNKGPKKYLNIYDELVKESKELKSNTYKVIAFPEHSHNTIREEDFSHMTKLLFEDQEFSVLPCYQRLLQANYGDYMQLPPLENRVSNHDTTVYWK